MAKRDGRSKTRLYRIWQGVKTRTNPKYKDNKEYKHYAGKGILMCEEWRNSFDNFKEWATSSGYSDNLSIDRIDCDGNYEPNNCRWITLAEQNVNRSTTHYITINGETKHVNEWSRISGLGSTTIHRRIERGWNENDLLIDTIDHKASYTSKIHGVSWNVNRNRWKSMGVGRVFIGWYHTEEKAIYAKIMWEQSGIKVHNESITVDMLKNLKAMLDNYDNFNYFDRGVSGNEN